MDKLEKYAKENNVPIMQKDGILYLCDYIKNNNIKSILEIGSAIGYSSIMMASVRDDIRVTTIEKDEERYNIAVNNIKEYGYDSQIDIYLGDASDYVFFDKFDLIFIDAAKGKNKDFFMRFEKNLSNNGYIITDNMSFHGYVGQEKIESRNIRSLVRKINEYIQFLEGNIKYKTKIYEIGDGIAVSEKRI